MKGEENYEDGGSDNDRSYFLRQLHQS
jgi:hypothetical protein